MPLRGSRPRRTRGRSYGAWHAGSSERDCRKVQPWNERSRTFDKVENPAAHFDKPKKIVQDKALSHDERKKALNTWEQDERQLLTASNEGMSGDDEGLQSEETNRLGEVVRAKAKIGEKPKHKPSQ